VFGIDAMSGSFCLGFRAMQFTIKEPVKMAVIRQHSRRWFPKSGFAS
jgi:hypothetical protein